MTVSTSLCADSSPARPACDPSGACSLMHGRRSCHRQRQKHVAVMASKHRQSHELLNMCPAGHALTACPHACTRGHSEATQLPWDEYFISERFNRLSTCDVELHTPPGSKDSVQTFTKLNDEVRDRGGSCEGELAVQGGEGPGGVPLRQRPPKQQQHVV